MDDLPLEFADPVTLAGGGALDPAMLDSATRVAPVLIAADGAADRLAAWGHMPAVVIGDMDSISDPTRWQDGPARLVHLSEQDTTDFEKCLYATNAPFYVAAGFTGGRVDHTLAVFHALLRYPDKPVFLLGEVEVMALLPPARPVSLALDAWATVSLYPLVPVRGLVSSGLRWPIDGLDFAAGRQVGTSNSAVSGDVEIAVDGPGMLVMLERRYLGTLIAGILSDRAGG